MLTLKNVCIMKMIFCALFNNVVTLEDFTDSVKRTGHLIFVWVAIKEYLIKVS